MNRQEHSAGNSFQKMRRKRNVNVSRNLDQSVIKRRRNIRDRILIGLSDPSTLLRIVERTYGASPWSAAGFSASREALERAIQLIDSESDRLKARIANARIRSRQAGPVISRTASDADRERIESRTTEIETRRREIERTLGRLKPELAVESIEWQQPLRRLDGAVDGFLDLAATIRVSGHSIVETTDPWDPEGRMRLESIEPEQTMRFIGFVIEPRVPSLAELVRRVRFVQAHAPNVLPIVVTCDDVEVDVLAWQGIPVYRWTTETAAASVPQALSTAATPHPVGKPHPQPPGPKLGIRELPPPRPSLPPGDQ